MGNQLSYLMCPNNELYINKGSIIYSDISKIDVLNQQESFKGEPKLFTH